jgi:hypothetical protein
LWEGVIATGMTSLAEVYEGKVGEGADLRRLYLGVGLFVVGSLLVIAGIVAAGTQTVTSELGIRTARRIAGILGGVGVPAVFLGVFTVLPAGRITRAAAIVGAGVALLGVSLFAHAYPCQWAGANCAAGDLTLPTAGVYFLGVITTFWCLFVGVANFKSRNDPGGTVELEVTRGGETKVIEVSKSKLDDTGSAPAAGGIGFFGDTPDGEIDTQTARVDDTPKARMADAGKTARSTDRGSTARSTDRGSTARSTDRGKTARIADPAGSVSDGGATSNEITGLTESETETTTSPTTPDSPNTPGYSGGGVGGSGGTGSVSGSGSSYSSGSTAGTSTTDSPGSNTTNEAAAGSPGDSYCGSCAHFQYVRTEDGMQPYCGYHDEVMGDMDACEEWTPR